MYSSKAAEREVFPFFLPTITNASVTLRRPVSRSTKPNIDSIHAFSYGSSKSGLPMRPEGTMQNSSMNSTGSWARTGSNAQLPCGSLMSRSSLSHSARTLAHAATSPESTAPQ